MTPTIPRKTNIDKLLEAHFAEDRSNFDKMNDRSDRMERLCGEIRKDISELTTCQKQHAQESALFRETVTKKLETIEHHTAPIIRNYEDGQSAWRFVKDKGAVVGIWAGFITGIGIIGLFIKKLFTL